VHIELGPVPSQAQAGTLFIPNILKDLQAALKVPKGHCYPEMPSREEYFDDESPLHDGGPYIDTEEEVTTTRWKDCAVEESEMPKYPDTDIGDELRRLYGLYGFDTSRRFERSDYEVRQTSDMVNEVFPPSQMGDNIYISKSVTANGCFEENTLG